MVRGGLGDHMHPKSWHCQKGGEALPLASFFEGFALRALQSDHLSPKSDNLPQNISFTNIYLTFSLSKMIYALLLKNVAKSHICAFMDHIRQDARIRGWGGRPNFGNARILGTFGAPP